MVTESGRAMEWVSAKEMAKASDLETTETWAVDLKNLVGVA
jgi:hypothetical protein